MKISVKEKDIASGDEELLEKSFRLSNSLEDIPEPHYE